MSHYSAVHPPIPTPKAMTNPEAKASVDKEWATIAETTGLDESEVDSEAEVTRRATLEGNKVLF